MAKNKKKKSRRQGMFSKVLNIAIILLGLSRPITIMVQNPNARGVDFLINEATFGLSKGALNFKAGMKFYSPAGAAVGLGFLKSYLIKKFPVRG